MLRINRKARTLNTLQTPKLSEVAITERYDLQEYICNSADAFFAEIGRKLFYVGKEIVPSDDVQDRIDILAMDKEGNAVVVELKRGNHKLQMLQAISYAGMISKWSAQDFTKLLIPERVDALADFLEVDLEEINRGQKIVLMAEAFDYSVLVSAEWLSERFGMDIVCCRLALAADESTGAEYLVCSNVYPAPELAQQAVKRGKPSVAVAPLKWETWDQALMDINNAEVIAFFKRESDAGRESYLRKRILRYRLENTRRWFVAARRKNAYVWQHGRFEGDVDFWRSRVSDQEAVGPVKDGECLRFFLATKLDFDSFLSVAQSPPPNLKWLNSAIDDDVDDVDAASLAPV